jgi:hypothetical protein
VASGELRRREGQRVVGRKKMEKEKKKRKKEGIFLEYTILQFLLRI